MFPTFIAYTNLHPRRTVLIGFIVFIFTALLWFYTCPWGKNIENQDAPIVSDARSLLQAPDVSDPSAVLQYETQVADASIETDTVIVDANCAMTPLILKMREGSILKIDNRDTADHTISFEDQNFFNVSADQVREINITDTFGKGSGMYRYKCSDISFDQNVGILYVTN